jgi:AraC family transcriptional activator of pobA
VTVILVHAWRLAGFHIDDTEMNWSGSASFQRFLQAVELHFREDWPVSRYAGQLGVTERRLHAAVTKAASKSPLQLRHLRILEAARSGWTNRRCRSRRSAMALVFQIPRNSVASSRGDGTLARRVLPRQAAGKPQGYCICCMAVRLRGSSGR